MVSGLVQIPMSSTTVATSSLPSADTYGHMGSEGERVGYMELEGETVLIGPAEGGGKSLSFSLQGWHCILSECCFSTGTSVVL